MSFDQTRGAWMSRFGVMALAFPLAVFGVGMGGPAAEAASVAFSFDGHITSADAGNAFGLSVGDIVTLSGSYDDSYYNGVGLGVVGFGQGTGNSLTVTLGQITLHQDNDVDYLDSSGDFPAIGFYNGLLAGTDILTLIGVNGSPVDFESPPPPLGGFEGADASGAGIAGYWDVVTVVPEPNSVALMGIGLAGAAGALGRRRPR